MSTTVRPLARARTLSNSSCSPRGSRAAVGSSRTSSEASLKKARATVTRCHSPIDSSTAPEEGSVEQGVVAGGQGRDEGVGAGHLGCGHDGGVVVEGLVGAMAMLAPAGSWYCRGGESSAYGAHRSAVRGEDHAVLARVRACQIGQPGVMSLSSSGSIRANARLARREGLVSLVVVPHPPTFRQVARNRPRRRVTARLVMVQNRVRTVAPRRSTEAARLQG